MQLILTVVLLFLLMPSGGIAHDYCTKAKCEETRQKIRRIEARMRQGYTRAQGEKMEAQLRSLRAVRSKRCR
jgi:hypothetical protein